MLQILILPFIGLLFPNRQLSFDINELLVNWTPAFLILLQPHLDDLHLDLVSGLDFGAGQRLLTDAFFFILQVLDHFAILLFTEDVVLLFRIFLFFQLFRLAKTFTVELIVLLVQILPVLSLNLDIYDNKRFVSLKIARFNPTKLLKASLLTEIFVTKRTMPASFTRLIYQLALCHELFGPISTDFFLVCDTGENFGLLLWESLIDGGCRVINLLSQFLHTVQGCIGLYLPSFTHLTILPVLVIRMIIKHTISRFIRA